MAEAQAKKQQPQFDSFWTMFKKHGVLPTLRTRLRKTIINLRHFYLTKIWGMDIHPDNLISLKVNLDKTHPKGIHIGEGTAISFDTVVLTHDIIRGLHLDTRIGKFCGIGARSIIMPGVTIGDHCVIGAGTVVTKDVPSGSVVVGNPGKVIRSDIKTGYWGKIIENPDTGIDV
ncbi:MAG: acyltransferase [Pseudomonadota bacterium]